MKKAIVWIAILLVAFIPTYILIFQGMKTAVPTVTLDATELRPAMVQWVTEDGEGNVEPTSPLQPVMDFIFRHSDPVVLTSLTEVGEMEMELTPSFAQLDVYDLTSDTPAPYATVSLDALRAGDVPVVTGPVQAVLAVEWVITDRIRVQAIYSFEVQS